jgi:tetratricopeptide (TPR) repeat protein
VKSEENRKLREEAHAAVAAGDHWRALQLYEQLCAAEPGEPVHFHRAGELLHRVGYQAEAIIRLHRAADLYAKAGFIAKAIACCKMILQIDPHDLEIQYELIALDEDRRRGTAKVAMKEVGPEPPAAVGADGKPVPALPPPELAPEPEPPPVDEAQAHLQRLLERQLGDLSRIPVVKMRNEEVFGLKLSTVEGFVLSQVDGRFSYQEILDAAGVPRLECLAILVKLVDDGVIGPRET